MAEESVVLDLSVVTTIQALSAPGEPDMFAEVMDLFLSEVPVQLSALRTAIGAGDIDAVRPVAHHLRGSALGIGAVGMASVCAAIEQGAPAPSRESLLVLADRLDREFLSVRRELKLVSPRRG